MAVVIAFTVLAAMLAVGDIAATKTKAVLGQMFVFAVLLLIAFWCGMPTNYIELTGATTIGGLCAALMLVSQGSALTLKQFAKEWKTVTIGFIQVALICVFCIVFGGLLMNKVMAYAGAPIVSGALVAYMVMTEPLTEAGMYDIASFCMMIMILQNFVGIPIAGALMRKDAKNLVASGEIEKYRYLVEETAGHKEKKSLIPALPEKYSKPSVLLFKGALVALLSFWVSGLTKGTVNSLLLCMIFGVVFSALGFIENNYLEKANAQGIVLMFVVFYIFASWANTTPEMVLNNLFPVVKILALGVVAILFGGFVCSKIFKVSFGMATAIGLTGLFGFPTTYYIAKTVSETVGENEADRQAIENYMLPKMLVAGFATVTIGSVVAASLMLPLLKNLLA